MPGSIHNDTYAQMKQQQVLIFFAQRFSIISNRLVRSSMYNVFCYSLKQEDLQRKLMGMEGQDSGTIQQQENFSIKGKSERNLVILIALILSQLTV